MTKERHKCSLLHPYPARSIFNPPASINSQTFFTSTQEIASLQYRAETTTTIHSARKSEIRKITSIKKTACPFQ